MNPNESWCPWCQRFQECSPFGGLVERTFWGGLMSPMTHNNAQHQGMLRLSLKSQSNNQAAKFPLDFIAGFGFKAYIHRISLQLMCKLIGLFFSGTTTWPTDGGTGHLISPRLVVASRKSCSSCCTCNLSFYILRLGLSKRWRFDRANDMISWDSHWDFWIYI